MTRTTAEIEADLRNHWGAVSGSVAIEAADRLADYETKLQEAIGFWEQHRAENQHINALRPTCPTCGGLRIIDKWNLNDETNERQPCPDCTNGKMPYERMAKIIAALFDPDFRSADVANTWGPCIDHLRDIR